MSNRMDPRGEEYRFGNLQKLIQYYRSYLPEAEIEIIILEAGMNFISRTFGTPEQERLQFIRRCESSLEAARSRMPGGKMDSVLPECASVDL